MLEMSAERTPDRPWIMRTYAGHSSAAASNALFRTNLSRGQTGLSVAFDLPTQLGYDPDDPLAAGEVGRVGVPVSHLGHMRELFADIPLAQANTSMTINAPAMYLLAAYIAVAAEQGTAPERLAGTTQNDIIKEFLARGTHIYPPGPSMRLTTDLICYTVAHLPRWNPINVCSYHLQEAGATPVQEIAYTIGTAMTVLDGVRDSGQVPTERLPQVAARMSFFLNAGMRFVEELCKVRALALLWRELLADRYGITDESARRLRYGVQVNSLGLTAAQPENNAYRIVLEMLGVTLGRDSRARAIQLPAWNEALGLPRPWDQQWALRAQQVLACETDLLEYDDIFAGSHVVESETARLVAEARAELERVAGAGGMVAAVESGYLKSQLVASLAARQQRRSDGSEVVVGVNSWTETAPSPLADDPAAVLTIDAGAVAEVAAGLAAWRTSRDGEVAADALAKLREAARSAANLMPATLHCVEVGVTVGEWAGALREVFGQYRAPTGLGVAPRIGAPAEDGPGALTSSQQALRAAVQAAEIRLGGRVRLLVAKPGLDGHSNGAEQVALCARDAGAEVVYQGIRQTPAQIVATAVAEDVAAIGLSILSGAHLSLCELVLTGLREAGVSDVPVAVGGSIPPADLPGLAGLGVAAVFTARDTDLAASLTRLVELIPPRDPSLMVGEPVTGENPA
ncbi:MAG: protein meaA [Candidatus Nanopelagicales bacterium]